MEPRGREGLLRQQLGRRKPVVVVELGADLRVELPQALHLRLDGRPARLHRRGELGGEGTGVGGERRVDPRDPRRPDRKRGGRLGQAKGEVRPQPRELLAGVCQQVGRVLALFGELEHAVLDAGDLERRDPRRQ